MDTTDTTRVAESLAAPRVGITCRIFNPTQAAALSGVPVGYHRELRRYQLMRVEGRDPAGRPKHSIFSVAYLMLVRMLADSMLMPQAHKIAQETAPAIVWHALQWHEAFSGLDRVFSWDPETFAQIEAWRAGAALLQRRDLPIAELIAEHERIMPTLEGSASPETQKNWARSELFKRRKVDESQFARFLIVWPTGHFVWSRSVDAELDGMTSGDARVRGLIRLLDMDALGSTLVDNAEKLLPFVHVEIDDGR